MASRTFRGARCISSRCSYKAAPATENQPLGRPKVRVAKVGLMSPAHRAAKARARLRAGARSDGQGWPQTNA